MDFASGVCYIVPYCVVSSLVLCCLRCVLSSVVLGVCYFVVLGGCYLALRVVGTLPQACVMLCYIVLCHLW